MKIEDIEDGRDLARQRADLLRMLSYLEQQKSFDISVYAGDKRWQMDIRDYDPPSNIGAAFKAIKVAITAMKRKELDGVEEALKALGVEA